LVERQRLAQKVRERPIEDVFRERDLVDPE
jgi:hypothetical protein